MPSLPMGQVALIGRASGKYIGVSQNNTLPSAFVTLFNPNGLALHFMSIQGANGNSSASAVALNSLGEVYVGGTTSGTSFRDYHLFLLVFLLPGLDHDPFSGSYDCSLHRPTWKQSNGLCCFRILAASD